MKVEVDDEDFNRAVAEDLLWNYEHVETKKLRKALKTAALYYMTYDQIFDYFGKEEADEHFSE